MLLTQRKNICKVVLLADGTNSILQGYNKKCLESFAVKACSGNVKKSHIFNHFHLNKKPTVYNLIMDVRILSHFHLLSFRFASVSSLQTFGLHSPSRQSVTLSPFYEGCSLLTASRNILPSCESCSLLC